MAIDSSIKNLRSQFNGWSEELKNTSPSGHGERQILTRPVEKILMVGGLESTPGSLNFWDNERLQVAAKTLMAN
ncbi:MAG: hypothetical protein K9G62_06990, partial [Alphaproteobacteria bacterium]|nr:hypothetical protein [Alphaproteobacteria bacterium]